MTDSSRLTTTADALALALETLADALARARSDEIAASEAALEAGTLAFRDAVTDSVASGRSATPEMELVIGAALARCRRLGVSLSLLTGSTSPFPDAPQGYSPAGQPLSSADGGTFLTARG